MNYNNIKIISKGRVKLIDDFTLYKESFKRFGDNLNGWTDAKEPYCGQEGQVTEMYGDKTVTIIFDDGMKLDFPMESVMEQITNDIGENGNFNLGGARLKEANEETFK
mgnify:CR=1 FL=1